MTKYSNIFIWVAIALLFTQCKKEEKSEETSSFDKATLLTNVGNNLIVPAYLDLKTAIEALEISWGSYKSSPNPQNLLSVQEKVSTANIAFQKAKIFNFGPAVLAGLRASLGTFPTDTTKIKNNIQNTSVNLYTFDNTDAIGFPSLEYLLFAPQNITNLSNADTRQYIDKLIAKMKTESVTVLDEWNTSYKNTFVNSTGTESTSGFSLLINAFNFDYELAKNAKLGIPIGKQSLGIAQMEYEEAAYSKTSLFLLKESISALYDVYKGASAGSGNQIGMDDYLIALDKNDINDEITARFTSILDDLNLLSNDLASEFQNQPAQLDALYTKLQNLVVYLKTDMTSAFSILITYQDNDGD